MFSKLTGIHSSAPCVCVPTVAKLENHYTEQLLWVAAPHTGCVKKANTLENALSMPQQV